MKFLIGLVVGAIVAAAIGAAAIAYASRDGDVGHFNISSDDDEDDDGEKSSRTLDLRDFDKIDVRGVFELDVKVGPDFAIAISGEADDLDRVISQRGTVGARLERLDAALVRHGDESVRLLQRVSELEDADLSRVIVELQSAETSWTALSAAAAKVLGRSLFDIIG